LRQTQNACSSNNMQSESATKSVPKCKLLNESSISTHYNVCSPDCIRHWPRVWVNTQSGKQSTCRPLKDLICCVNRLNFFCQFCGTDFPTQSTDFVSGTRYKVMEAGVPVLFTRRLLATSPTFQTRVSTKVQFWSRFFIQSAVVSSFSAITIYLAEKMGVKSVSRFFCELKRSYEAATFFATFASSLPTEVYQRCELGTTGRPKSTDSNDWLCVY
jgi:hypothetical protein